MRIIFCGTGTTMLNPQRAAAAIAQRARVGTLALTHLLPTEDEAALWAQAAERFDGSVVVARDGFAFEVPAERR